MAYTLRKDVEGRVMIWGQHTLEVHIDTSLVKHVGGAMDAVKAGFLGWTSGGVPMKIKWRTAAAPLKAGNDGKNVVGWQNAGWTHGQEVLGITITTYSKQTGLVKDSDILLNAKDHQWAVVSPGDPLSRFDIQNTVAHEVGHFFGLEHSAEVGATMYASMSMGETSKRSLSADDRSGIAALIQEINSRSKNFKADTSGTGDGNEAGQGPLPSRELGGCSMATGAPGGLWVWGVILGWLLTLRRARSLPRAGSRMLLGGLTLLVIQLCGAAQARASVVRALSLAQLASRAEVVMQGQVVDQTSQWEGRLIITRYKVKVTRCLKAATQPPSRTIQEALQQTTCSDTMTLRVLGGRLGDQVMVVAGQPQPSRGDTIIVFGRRTSTGDITSIGLAQGMFQVKGALAVRNLQGLQLMRDSSMKEGKTETYSLASIVQALRAPRR